MRIDAVLSSLGRTLLICAVSLAGTAHAVDVAVPAGSSSCQPGAEVLYIYIDNEDGNNANTYSGWIGGIVSTENTRLQFCRVNGDLLHGVATNERFMVLRLGSSCPAGTTWLLRRVDGENTRDGPESSSNIPGTLVDGAVTITPDVNLDFCVYPANSGGLPFPDLGMSYGVFASDTFTPALHRGSIYMDDQDNNNANFWCENDSLGGTTCSGWTDDRDYWGIIRGGRNTGLSVVHVHEAPPPPSCVAMRGGSLSLAPLGLVFLTFLSRRRRQASN